MELLLERVVLLVSVELSGKITIRDSVEIVRLPLLKRAESRNLTLVLCNVTSNMKKIRLMGRNR